MSDVRLFWGWRLLGGKKYQLLRHSGRQSAGLSPEDEQLAFWTIAFYIVTLTIHFFHLTCDNPQSNCLPWWKDLKIWSQVVLRVVLSLLAVLVTWPWACNLPFLNINFPICKMKYFLELFQGWMWQGSTNVVVIICLFGGLPNIELSVSMDLIFQHTWQMLMIRMHSVGSMVIADTNTMAFSGMGFLRKMYFPLQLGLQGYQCSLFPSHKKACTSHLSSTWVVGIGEVCGGCPFLDKRAFWHLGP